MFENDAWVLKDLSKNGTFIKNKRCLGQKPLRFGDVIDIFGLRLVYLEKCLAVDTGIPGLAMGEGALIKFTPEVEVFAEKKKKVSTTYFKRWPRTLGKLYDEPLEIEGPPAPQKMRRQPLLLP